MGEQLKIRPYARLLTMLGDQLIKNEQIAVIELIKNSYDADAEWVKVSFDGFGSNYKTTSSSRIIIEDNGIGMEKQIIEKSWMSPATPNKFSEDGEIRYSASGKRIIQGEKGIGRFAVLKLGRSIKMITRPLGGDVEYVVNFDLTSYDDNFLSVDQKPSEIYLDQLNFELEERVPSVFVERDVVVDGFVYGRTHNTHGTRIEITDIKGKWSEKKVHEVVESFVRFSSVFDELNNDGVADVESEDMRIAFFENSVQKIKNEDPRTQLKNLLDQKTVFTVTKGRYDSHRKKFSFNLNSVPKELFLNSPEILGLKVFKDWFFGKDSAHEVSDFGDFEFDFYIFDFNAKGSSIYALSQPQKDLIKRHRVYLLRDGIRVLPYGDPDDDWLQIDVGRGTFSAGSFFSNDQIVGRVKITKAGNPHLKDKTNREGLIDSENFTADFVCVIKSILSYLRLVVYKDYLREEKLRKDVSKIQKDNADDIYNALERRYKDDAESMRLLSSMKSSYDLERKYLQGRMERSEHLAAVGLSVETANHDIMMMLLRSLDILSSMKKMSDGLFYDITTLHKNLDEVIELHNLIISQMRDMQGLFVSSRKRPKWQMIKPFIDKILRIYKNYLKKQNVSVTLNSKGKEIEAFCMDADIMQLVINLLDNSIYWLDVNNKPDKRIEILLDGDKSTMLFSDSGCGISKENRDFVFDPFFSTKGEEGRGLGLYISKRLLERCGNSIRLAEAEEECLLCGASFVITFKEKAE